MRAVVSEDVGGPSTLIVREVAEPELSRGAVLVEVRSAAVNFPDLLVIEDRYQFKPMRPFTPGGEVAGIVRAVGHDVTGLEPGDRVIANVGIGGFAERAVTPAERCYRIPDAMPFDVASTLLYTYGTTFHALVDRAQLRRGERMLVLGAAGGVGVAAIQLGRALGADVIAAARGDDKLAFCRAQGAVETIDYAKQDLKSCLKEIGGVDLVYDPVGGEYTEAAIRGLRPNGRLVVIGFASGTIPRIPLNLILLKECSIVGVQWGAWALRDPEAQGRELRELISFWERGEIAPQIEGRYPLDHATDALALLAARRVRGKVVVLP